MAFCKYGFNIVCLLQIYVVSDTGICNQKQMFKADRISKITMSIKSHRLQVQDVEIADTNQADRKHVTHK